ncbi:MAG: hypothetical protein WC533_01405 [Candidatus Pacearchaeota archaeon]
MKWVFALLTLILAIPAGYILKKMTKEEIRKGRKYFKLISISSLILAVILYFIKFGDSYMKFSAILTLIFIAIVSFISWK